jgi:hypothetical protein
MLTHVLVHQWRKPLKAQTDNGKRDTKDQTDPCPKEDVVHEAIREKIGALVVRTVHPGALLPFPPPAC